MDFEVTEEVIKTIAELAQVEIPAGDITSLTGVLANQLGMAEHLRPLDLLDTLPITSLDPRWR
jgi:Asp-tRNA(Asn)/Glu-tRNA(Gln) amidotransferase C subunit